MVAASDDHPSLRKFLFHDRECVKHQFQSLVSSPLSEGQDAMLGISAAGKIRKLGPASQNAVRTDMYIVAAIFLIQDPAVTGHQYGH